MEAGRLRHRITIEQPQQTQDEYGEPVETWATLTEAWAAREDLAGREYFAAQAQQTKAAVTTRFRLRYLDGVTARCRVVSEGVTYEIDSVQDPDGRRRELILMAVREG